jgi:hypothetical protein
VIAPYFEENHFLLMDRSYQGDSFRSVAKTLGYDQVVSPKRNRIHSWVYDKEIFKRINKIERFFGELSVSEEFVFVIYSGFIIFTMIVDSLVRTLSSFFLLTLRKFLLK